MPDPVVAGVVQDMLHQKLIGPIILRLRVEMIPFGLIVDIVEGSGIGSLSEGAGSPCEFIGINRAKSSTSSSSSDSRDSSDRHNSGP